MYYIAGKALAPSSDHGSCPGCVAVNKENNLDRVAALQQFLSRQRHGKNGGKKGRRGPGRIFLLLSLVITLCLLGNWGFKAFTTGWATQDHVHNSSCGQTCPIQAAQKAASESAVKTDDETGAELSSFQQFFCPIIDLPAMHGVVIDQ